jgi:ABC-2 type transport system permease protein
MPERGVAMSELPSPAAAGGARILDRGYRRYEGERRGVGGALRTLTRHSVQRALGLRRSPWAKVLPVLTIVISYLPAVVFVGIVSLIPEREITDFALPTYGEYFLFIQSAVILFVAFVAPELLCPDRRTGMLGLYLASPLTRDTYLAAKALATALVLAFVTIGPPFLMLIAFIIQGQGPDGPAAVAATVARVVGAGLAITVLFTAVSLGISSLTDRKAFATAGLILVFLVSSAVTGVLVGALQAPDGFQVFDLFTLPFALVVRIHGERHPFEGVTLGAAVLGSLAWTVLGAAVARLRYQRLQVTR